MVETTSTAVFPSNMLALSKALPLSTLGLSRSRISANCLFDDHRISRLQRMSGSGLHLQHPDCVSNVGSGPPSQ
ncbi:MAG: hypothetical protein AAGF50_04940, partial [Pseudomonadota bacterium]